MPTLSGLADVVRSLGTPGTVTLERTNSAGGSNVEGVWVTGSKSTRVMDPTIVHPISGRDRILLPEGVRTRETIVTYATEPLQTATEFGPAADVLIHRPLGQTTDQRYVVQTTEDWGHVSGHWRVFSTREPKG
jgi:hypothetical protein